MRNNYANIPSEYTKKETAKIALIPVPYDGPEGWKKGSDKAPEAFLKASESMELYDIETDAEVYKQGIFLTDDVTENSSSESMSSAVYEKVKKHLNTNKFVTLVGGEQGVSIGSIKAFNEYFQNLTVLQIDAHANLKKEHLGSKINHNCRMYHASQSTNLVQVGVRSMSKIEQTVIDNDKIFFTNEMATNDYWVENAIDTMTENVYITIDLDALDPSILPAVGYPEPGGLFWHETLEFLKSVFSEKNVVGFDILGLCPNEQDKSSDALTARLYYKMLSYKFELEKEDNLEMDEDDFNTNKNKIGKFSKNEE